MRLAVAFSAITQGVTSFIGSQSVITGCVFGTLEILVGAAPFDRLPDPIASAVASLINLVTGITWSLAADSNAHDKTLAAFYLVVISISIILLGPGAFSLDARLFGRREIIIPELPRPPFS